MSMFVCVPAQLRTWYCAHASDKNYPPPLASLSSGTELGITFMTGGHQNILIRHHPQPENETCYEVKRSRTRTKQMSAYWPSHPEYLGETYDHNIKKTRRSYFKRSYPSLGFGSIQYWLMNVTQYNYVGRMNDSVYYCSQVISILVSDLTFQC